MTQPVVSYQQTRWSLADLIPDASQAAIEKRFADIRAQVQGFVEQARPILKDDLASGEFLSLIDQQEKITLQAYHLIGYASLSFSANTQDQAAQALLARVQQFMAEIQNQTLFFELWW